MLKNIWLYKGSVAVYVIAMLLSIMMARVYDWKKYKINKISRYIYFILISLPYSSVIGFRRIDVGYDTKGYVRWLNDPQLLDEREILFKYIVEWFHKINFSYFYTPMLLFFAFLTIFSLLYAVDTLDRQIPVSEVLFLYYMYFGFNMTDQMRQLTAMSIFLLSISLGLRKKYLMSGIVFLLAFGIHRSVLFGAFILGIIFLLNLNMASHVRMGKWKIIWKPRLICVILIGLISVISATTVWIHTLYKIVPEQYKFYFKDKINFQSIGLGLFLDIMPILFMIFLGKTLAKDKAQETLFSFSCFGIIFRLIGYYSYFVARMSYYSVLTAIVLLPLGIRQSCWSNRIVLKPVMVMMGILYFLIFYICMMQHGALPYYPVFF